MSAEQDILGDPLFNDMVDVLWGVINDRLPPQRLRDFLDKLLGAQPILPLPGEIAIIAPGCEKTAALFYDRVWWGAVVTDIPASVVVRGRTALEDNLLLYAICAGEFGSSRVPPANEAALCQYFARTLFPYVDTSRPPKHGVVRPIAMELRAKFGLSLSSLYTSTSTMAREYTEGDRAVVVASLENLRVIDEASLSWEQVMELRQDVGARSRLRAMMHWLDKEMIGKSQQFIEDEIALKVEAYERALREHGIKTITGALKQAMELKQLLPPSVLSGTLALADQPTWGLVLGGGLFIGAVLLKAFERMMDFEDVERGANSEVAYVCEIKQATG